MSTIHVVKPGECLSKIAHAHGFAGYEVLYEHPDNAALKQARPNPNLLFPGDEVVIPERESKTRQAATEQIHTWKVVVPKKVLRLTLRDAQGVPMKNVPYRLEVGGKRIEAATDAEGKLEHPVWVGAEVARLHVAERVLELRLGYVNPLDGPDDGVSGAQARLINLGYPTGRTDGVPDRATRMALALFQHDQGLPITGELDGDTTARIQEEHGC